MVNADKKIKVMLLEKDTAVLEKIQERLETRPYEITQFAKGDEALAASKETPFDLVFVGYDAEGEDPIDLLKAFVMASPMTSIIMVIDLTDSEVEEKAEGYGILGNVNRDVPAENLFSLLDSYEKIQQSLNGI